MSTRLRTVLVHDGGVAESGGMARLRIESYYKAYVRKEIPPRGSEPESVRLVRMFKAISPHLRETKFFMFREPRKIIRARSRFLQMCWYLGISARKSLKKKVLNARPINPPRPREFRPRPAFRIPDNLRGQPAAGLVAEAANDGGLPGVGNVAPEQVVGRRWNPFLGQWEPQPRQWGFGDFAPQVAAQPAVQVAPQPVFNVQGAVARLVERERRMQQEREALELERFEQRQIQPNRVPDDEF